LLDRLITLNPSAPVVPARSGEIDPAHVFGSRIVLIVRDIPRAFVATLLAAIEAEVEETAPSSSFP
jgi:hypothetical protein